MGNTLEIERVKPEQGDGSSPRRPVVTSAPRVVTPRLVLFAIMAAITLGCLIVGTMPVRWLVAPRLYLAALTFVAMVELYYTMQLLVHQWTVDKPLNRPAGQQVDIPEIRRDVHLARYEHLNSEVTRYRDLTWKLTGFAWAIDLALIKSMAGSRAGGGWFDPRAATWAFPVAMFLTALAATVFYLFCEEMIQRNRDGAHSLEVQLGLDREWEQSREKAQPKYFEVGVGISVIIFGIAIWAPPLSGLFLSQ